MQVDFPKLSYMERNRLDQKRITFAEALKKENTDFPVLSKQRIASFLKVAYRAIEETKLITQEEPSKSKKKKSEPEAEPPSEPQLDQQPAA